MEVDRDSSPDRPSDAVLPAQFWTNGTSPEQPEKRLLAAVLEEAIALLLRAPSNDEEQTQAALDACDWLHSDDRTGPFAFASVCDVLGLDAEGVRSAIERMRDGERGFVRPRNSAGAGRHRIRQRRRRSRRAA